MEIGRPYSRLLSRLERSTALSGEDRQLVADLPLTVANFSANQEISHRADEPRCTLVLSGFLYGHKRVGGSRRQITSLLVPGDVGALNGLYLQKPDQHLSALGSAVVAFFPYSAFEYMLERSPRLSRAFWREASIEAAILREWVANLGRREALARVAHVVCELVMRLQAVDLARNLCFSIPWTQVDVADACGISGVHANRVVQELRRLELVDWDTRQLRIRDWDTLARIGDFSGDYLQLSSELRDDPVNKAHLGPLEAQLQAV
jgi:CRP-like cAMP-binding protein